MRNPLVILRLVLTPLVVAVVLAFGVRAAVRVYSIPSASMTPSLQVGDHIAVTPYRSDQLQRGDVVVFRSPSGQEIAVKRVVALPGDLIEVDGGRVRISGRTLSEPYLAPLARTDGISAQLVPAGCLFVMGDNRQNSLDSRHWGPLPRQRVVGRARMILWSSASTEPAGGGAAHASPVSGSRFPAARSRVERFFKWIE